jgi:site-specific recombinase XerD
MIRGLAIAKKTVQASRNVLSHFSTSCKKEFFDDVDRSDLEKYMDKIAIRYKSDWTVHNYMINILAFMRASGRPGLMKNSEIPNPESDPTKVKAYREDQIRRLFSAANDTELVWLNFFLYSACRWRINTMAVKRSDPRNAVQLTTQTPDDFMRGFCRS